MKVLLASVVLLPHRGSPCPSSGGVKKSSSVGILKRQLILLAAIALAFSSWPGAMIMAQGEAQFTPEAMIQSNLPQSKTILTARETELMEALCRAVKKWPQNAAAIVRTAVSSRKDLRREILTTVIRCTRDRLDCGWVANIAREWIKAEPSSASEIADLISICAPQCSDALQGALGSQGEFGNPPQNINSPPGSFGGGGGSESPCLVCHNNQEIQIACGDVSAYLASHPGDTAGACQVTPSANR